MNVINCFEHQNLAITDLPEKWRSKSVLKELENFLQNNWDQRGIFYSDDKQDSRQCFIDFDKRDGIRTQNYIGTIAYGGGQINIFPKVYRQDKTDISQLKTSDLVQDFVNWLSYCDKLNFPFISHKDELANTNSLLELLITVYLHFVQESLKKQLYHRYEETVETGAYIKGKINLKDYAQLKYPSGQHHLFTYTYSNFQFDNALNRIIKSTCSLLFQMTEQDSNIRILRNILMRLSDVSTVDSTPYDCDQVYLSMAHKDYQIILDMSRMFLYNKISTYTSGDSRTFCFLFPAELLFEEYIAGLMKEIFGSDQVSTQMRDTNLAELYVDGSLEGRAFSLREDILFTTAKGDIVLDTKYKRSLPFDRIDADKKLGVSDADAKQMLAYAIKRGAKKLYLIYPLYRGEKVESQRVVYRIDMEILG
ncbi:MAG: hypothetical protein GX777_10515, partial [Fastidiosipila sp.]|nr:hypothetical protein [Fastidiosipila sp.]